MKSLYWSCARLYTLLFVFSAVGGCAYPAPIPLTEHTSGPRASLDEDSARIFIYREKQFAGSALGVYIAADGQRIGALNDGTYFVYEAAPGSVAISAESSWEGEAGEYKSIRQLDVEAEQVYYLKGEMRDQTGVAYSFHLEIVNDLEGEQALKALTYATLE